VRRFLVALVFGSLPIALAFADEPPHVKVILAPQPEAGADVQSPSLPYALDPQPLVSREQWVFDLRWSKGDVYLLGIRDWDAGAPRETPRVMGRFAIELWEGKTLVERVRFDFPLLGSPEDGGHFALPSMQAKLTTRIGVIFPKTKRGTRFELVDRATNTRWDLPFPGADGG
jgi:hypothetical protein